MNDPNVSDPLANEAYILDNPTIKSQWITFRDKCLNSDFVDPSDESYCDTGSGIVDAGSANSNVLGDSTAQLFNRFRVYQLDLGMAGGLDFTTGNITTLPDDDSNQ